MAKDKLVTIPIEAEKRDRLNKYCQDNHIKVSELITGFIDKVLSNDIDTSRPSSISIPSIDTQNTTDAALLEKLTDLTDGLDLSKKLYNHIGEFTTNSLQIIFERLEAIELAIGISSKSISTPIEHPIDTSISTPIEHPIDTSISTPIEHSIDTSISTPIEHSIEDTKTLISQKFDSRRTTKGNRITLEEIATQLTTYNYPHPQGKKWTRSEVTKIAKLWEIRTN